MGGARTTGTPWPRRRAHRRATGRGRAPFPRPGAPARRTGGAACSCRIRRGRPAPRPPARAQRATRPAAPRGSGRSGVGTAASRAAPRATRSPASLRVPEACPSPLHERAPDDAVPTHDDETHQGDAPCQQGEVRVRGGLADQAAQPLGGPQGTAKGLGSLISEATAHANFPLLAGGIALMSLVVVGWNRIVWRSLMEWARTRFGYAQ